MTSTRSNFQKNFNIQEREEEEIEYFEPVACEICNSEIMRNPDSDIQICDNCKHEVIAFSTALRNNPANIVVVEVEGETRTNADTLASKKQSSFRVVFDMNLNNHKPGVPVSNLFAEFLICNFRDSNKKEFEIDAYDDTEGVVKQQLYVISESLCVKRF